MKSGLPAGIFPLFSRHGIKPKTCLLRILVLQLPGMTCTFQHPRHFYLTWNNTYQGLADGFTVSSVNSAKQYKEQLSRKNPNLITIAELRYRDAPSTFLPEDSPWWMRNNDGSYVYGWEEGNFIRIEFRDAAFQDQVAKKRPH